MKNFKYFITESVGPKKIHVKVAEQIYPMPEDFKDKELKQLFLIKSVNDIKSLKYETWWEDDFTKCYGLEINGFKVGLWWYGEEYWNEYIKQIPNLNKLNSEDRHIVLEEIYGIVLQEQQRIEHDPNQRSRMKKINKEIEMLDKLKPETQKHFNDIIGNL